MHFHVITLFKDAIESYVNESIVGRAKGEKKIKVTYYNPRHFAGKKVGYVDGKPYGGGPGMVLQALPIVKSVEKALSSAKSRKKVKVIILSPNGTQFTNDYAHKLSKNVEHIILIAGRYEGIDSRVNKILRAEEISAGPYILTGGELPAAMIIDAVSRQLKGVLGNFESREESRIAGSEVYTRPEVLEYKGKKYKVPRVLLSGNHAKIKEWKAKHT